MRQFEAGKTSRFICNGCNKDFLVSASFCVAFLQELCKFIAMTPISGPHIKIFSDENDPSKDGISGVLMIAESHIAIHTWPNSGAARIIIDSCTDYDVGKTFDWLLDTLDCWNITTNTIGK